MLLFLFLALYSSLAFIRLPLAVMFFLFALPSYVIRFQVLGIPTTLLEVMILASFSVWFVFRTNFFLFLKGSYDWSKFIANKKKRLAYPFAKEIILILIISYVAIAVSGFSNSSLGIWKAYFFEPLLVFILIFNVFKEKSGINFNKILWPLFLSAFFVSALAIYQKFTGAFIFNPFWAEESTRRVTSFFGYPNAVGLYLGPLLVLMMGYLFQLLKQKQNSLGDNFKKYKYQILFLVLNIIFSSLAIYFAKSEGAIIGVAGAFFVCGLFVDKVFRRLFLALLIICIGFVYLNQPIKDYVIEKITLKNLSGEIRKQQWQETWEMLNDGNMLWGAGLANYQNKILPYHQEGIFFNKENDPDFRRKIVIYNDKYRQEHWQPVEIYMYPHNIFLNFWTELGLLGMLVFVWLIAKYFFIGFTLQNRIQENKFLVLGLIGAMAVIVIHGLVDVPYFKNDLSVMFWVFVGLMGGLRVSRINNF